ncbi:MAG: TolC family protein [Flavisolibacter sp.]|nr:TolC family protein [Flavisolibacter sp.]
MKIKLIGSLLLLAGFTQAQQRYELSAKQAADFARQNNAQVKNALLDVQIQQQTNKEITASAYPQINANASLNYYPNVGIQTFPNFIAAGTYGVLKDEGVLSGSGAPITTPSDFGFIQAQFGTKFVNTAGASLQQLLFDGQVFVGLQARRASIDFRNKAVEVTEENIRANVYKVYYQLAASRSQIAILDANIANVQKLLSDTRKIFENGFAEKLDISKLEVQVNNLLTERQKALNNISNGYIGLKFLIGMPIRDSLILTDSITYNDIRSGVFDAMQYNYADRKEYQYAELGKTLSEYNIKRYKLSKLPTLSLSSNFNYLRQANNFGFGGQWFPSSLVGLNVNVPLFDGFAKNARIKRAQLELQQNVNNIENLKLTIDLDVQQAINNYTNALATLEAQKRNRELAEQVYAQTRLKFQEGIGSSTEISSAQTDLQTAQNNYILALYDASNARIDFLKATGKLQ